MRRKSIATTKIELEEDVDRDFAKWAEEVGRSKRRQYAVLLRRINVLRKTQPQELQRLQLAQ